MTFGSSTQKPMDQPHSGDEVADWTGAQKSSGFLAERKSGRNISGTSCQLGQGSTVTFTVRMTFSMKREQLQMNRNMMVSLTYSSEV